MKFYIYILRCTNGSYYIGHSIDPEARFMRHSIKDGARHTKQNAPSELLYTEVFDSEADAVKRELQLKRWSRAKKEALIKCDLDALCHLSKSRD